MNLKKQAEKSTNNQSKTFPYIWHLRILIIALSQMSNGQREEEIGMHTLETIRRWGLILREDGVRFSHKAKYLVRKKDFWGLIVILGTLITLFFLVLINSKKFPLERYNTPIFYGEYF